jgi:hypothetical protein
MIWCVKVRIIYIYVICKYIYKARALEYNNFYPILKTKLFMHFFTSWNPETKILNTFFQPLQG